MERGDYRLAKRTKTVLFKKMCNEYMDYAKDNKRSWKRDAGSIKHIVGFFGNAPIERISSFQIEKFKRERKNVPDSRKKNGSAKAVSQATVNRELSCLKHMFTKAVEWGMLESNPAKGVSLYKETLKPIQPLTEDEEARLLSAAEATPKAPHLKPVLVLALNAGMRLMEILHLKWENINFDKRMIVLSRTKNSELRYVDMNSLVHRLLRELKSQSGGATFLFAGRQGKPFTSIKTAFYRARREAGIPDTFRFHDLRHTFGSRLVMGGVDLPTVQALMGHKSIRMTLRYTHLSADHKRKAIEMLVKSDAESAKIRQKKNLQFTADRVTY